MLPTLLGRKLSPQETHTLLQRAQQRDLWHWKAIGLERAIALAGNRGEGVRIGIIDSGVDYAHPELQRQYGGGCNLLRDPKIPFTDCADIDGHGTAVTSVICGTNVGIVPDAQYFAVRVPIAAQDSASGIETLPKPRTYTSLAAAIYHCVNNFQCDLINMSVGIHHYDSSLEQAVQDAYQKQIPIVAAAGNSSSGAFFPGTFDATVLSVGGSTPSGSRFAKTNIWSTLDLLAPARDILAAGTIAQSAQLRYQMVDGTSFAAAITTGVLALAIGYSKKRGRPFTVAQLGEHVRSTTQPPNREPQEVEQHMHWYDPTRTIFSDVKRVERWMYGSGLLNADRFMHSVREGSP